MAILIFNGSPSGKKGNCQKLITKIQKELERVDTPDEVSIIHLSEIKWTRAQKKRIFTQLVQANGFIFVTGTYWDSWGSPLQIFLEHVTDLEASPEFLGKPAAVFILNHSVGGKGVLSRLQGVLSCLGCLIPPMSGMVYSWTNQQILKDKRKSSNAQNDLWSLDDITQILTNFKKALQIKVPWNAWPVDRKDYRKIWL